MIGWHERIHIHGISCRITHSPSPTTILLYLIIADDVVILFFHQHQRSVVSSSAMMEEDDDVGWEWLVLVMEEEDLDVVTLGVESNDC